VTKTQPAGAGPISCLEHRTTRVLHCTIVTKAAVIMFPLLLQTVISNHEATLFEVCPVTKPRAQRVMPSNNKDPSQTLLFVSRAVEALNF